MHGTVIQARSVFEATQPIPIHLLLLHVHVVPTHVDLLLGAVGHGGAGGGACRCLCFRFDGRLHLGDDAARATSVSHVHLAWHHGMAWHGMA